MAMTTRSPCSHRRPEATQGASATNPAGVETTSLVPVESGVTSTTEPGNAFQPIRLARQDAGAAAGYFKSAESPNSTAKRRLTTSWIPPELVI